MVGIVAAVCALGAKRPIPSKVILEADFEKGLVEYVPDDPVARIVSGRAPTVLGVVEALERAATDDRVVGLIARVGEAGLSAAQIQEIRDAIIEFRSKGKPAIAYAETFGEGGKGNGSYYLATAFDEICLQPSGGDPVYPGDARQTRFRSPHGSSGRVQERDERADREEVHRGASRGDDEIGGVDFWPDRQGHRGPAEDVRKRGAGAD
jgi:protease-4